MKRISRDIRKFIRKETSLTTAKLWGEPLTFKPALCPTVLGNGLQFIYVGTIDQRPAYWIMRISSKTDIDSSNFDAEQLIEILEDCFGKISDDSFESEDELLENNIHFPAVYATGGWHWGLLKNFGNDLNTHK